MTAIDTSGQVQPPTLLKAAYRSARLSLGAMRGRLKAATSAGPRFVGAHPDFATALSAIRPGQLRGYDHEEIADVSFAAMCELALCDYPVLYQLRSLCRPGLRVLDAGGHMGTKYIAFAPHLPLEEVRWTVSDLPGIVAAARRRQAEGALPAALRFVDAPEAAGRADVLLASGLLQYLDVPFAQFVERLPERPPVILLNKVATREGAPVVTLERIGAARVPYQIRSRTGFEAEIAEMGYEISSSWKIPELSHVIATHPALGASTSRGYCLTLRAPG